MACAQKKKAGSPKKKKTSAKVASPKAKKSKEDAIIDLSQTGWICFCFILLVLCGAVGPISPARIFWPCKEAGLELFLKGNWNGWLARDSDSAKSPICALLASITAGIARGMGIS